MTERANVIPKCITLWEPWASLALGIAPRPWRNVVKDVENRGWPISYRGQLFIHASKATVDLDQLFDMYPDHIGGPKAMGRTFRTRGHVIGAVDLFRCEDDSDSPWAQPGQFHWVFRDPVPLETPIEYTGSQGIFNLSQAVFSTKDLDRLRAAHGPCSV